MGAIEDVRKAFQDIVAPDLKALQVEVREGFVSVERVAAIRHELVLAELRTALAVAESRHEAILKAPDLDRRLERVEARQASQQASA
jgi:Lon protease-like protein